MTKTLSNLSVVPALPCVYGPERTSEMPKELVGAKIMRIGMPSAEEVDSDVTLEGGGLVIDFQPKSSECVRRIVFSFNELAMWIIYRGPC
jgi:hypothetical protein